MSTVYLAIQISVGRIVALKVMNPSLTSDPAFSERFQREATIVGQLSHPNIVAIYDIGRADDLNYIAMDYLPNGSVHDKMIKGMTAEEALRVTKEIANALDHAHEKGYIHRDIKPENILFRADNSAVLSDFGVAKGIVGVSRMTHVGTVVGTPHYMSPEQTRGQTVDARSDLYSLGVLFFEMLTGFLPYQGEDTVTIALKHISAPIPKLPPQYQAYQKMLEKFLAKDPADRFQSGQEVSEAIDQLDAAARTPYVPPAAPEDLSVMALIRALLAATAHAIRWRWNRLINLRWNKEEGFHTRKSFNDSVFGSEIAPTIFATRIQQATHINPLLFKTGKRASRILLIALITIALWCLFSVLLVSSFKRQVNQFPAFLKTPLQTTASIFISSPKVAPPPTPKKIAVSSVSSSVSSSLAMSAAVSSEAISSDASSQSSLVQSSSGQSSSSSVATYTLSVKAIPEDARIRLLNIPAKYKEGITLPSGRYNIEVSKSGYKTKTEWLEIKNDALKATFTLEAEPDVSNPAKATIPNIVYGGKNAPAMIRIPAGSFTMGNDRNVHSSPAHKVTLKAFAIGKYEVTFEEYDFFAKSTNKPLPGDNGWGREDRPVIHVSWNDALAYTQWLSKTTGKKFRLPTEAEWEYAARAGTSTTYWWGEDEAEAKGKANCRRGCLSNFSGLFGSKTAPVGNYTPNLFGLYDMSGNVSEWVQDCYQDNYNNASSTGAAAEEKQCTGRVVRGGSTKDNVQHLSTSARDNIPSGYLNETLGFRVVMELN